MRKLQNDRKRTRVIIQEKGKRRLKHRNWEEKKEKNREDESKKLHRAKLKKRREENNRY